MPYALKYGLFVALDKPDDIKALMKKDLKSAIGKSIKFVAAKNYKVGGRVLDLFIATDTPNDFVTFLGKKGATVASGEAVIDKSGSKPTVIVTKSTGGLTAKVITTIVPLVDNSMAGSVEGAPNVPEMVKRSHEQARKEGKLDWEFKPTDEIVHRMAMVTMESGEYQKFAGAFNGFAQKYHLADAKKVPVDIWSSLVNGLAKSGYVKGIIPNAGDPDQFILAFKGSDGKPVREKALAEAMKSLEKFVAHAANYMDKVVNEIAKGGGGKTWAFWSGTGAQDAAKREAQGGVVLEGSVGSWFDAVWDFKALTGVENLALWAALSEMYAQKAAEYYSSFSFVGYLGPGATRDQSVFNKIEQPTLLAVLDKKKTVPAPKIKWFVVDCNRNPANGRWEPTNNPSASFGNRGAALGEITKRYGS